jgi:hypothetical protein
LSAVFDLVMWWKAKIGPSAEHVGPCSCSG